MRVYLVRHGETVLNRRRCYYGWTDAPLTANGQAQAKRLAGYFEKQNLDKVVVSPLSRAVETANLILAENTKDIDKDDRLREQNFGIFEGFTYQELMKKYPEEMEKWNCDFSHYRIPEGESFSDVRKRIDSFIADLPKGEGTMLIVAHKGTLGHFLAACLGLPLEGYWNFVFDQGCYSCVDLEDGYAIIRKLNQSINTEESNGFI